MLCCLALILLSTTTASAVWPPPKSMDVSGPLIPLAVNLSIQLPKSRRLSGALQRTLETLKRDSVPTSSGEGGERALSALTITIDSPSETLDIYTPCGYNVTVAHGRAHIAAQSVYGAMYGTPCYALARPPNRAASHRMAAGLETFAQLVVAGSIAATVNVTDEPDYSWRGLMIDSGRRFVPVATLKNLIDTMAAVKLNVLHLHASDMCRFGVESKLYPNLTASLSGIRQQFCTLYVPTRTHWPQCAKCDARLPMARMRAW